MDSSNIMDLKGLHALVTGSTSGIGLALAKKLVERGCHVFLTGSTQQKCDKAVERVAEEVSEKIQANKQEISRLISSFPANMGARTLVEVKGLVDFIKLNTNKLDFLFVNAGMIYSGRENISEEAMDLVFRVNCLSQFHLTTELLPLLENSKFPGRVIFTSSSLMFGGSKELVEELCVSKPFDPSKEWAKMGAYCNSKLCLSIFAQELHHRLRNSSSKVVVINFVPGMVVTSLSKSKGERDEIIPTSSDQSSKASWWGDRHKFSADEGAMFLLQAGMNDRTDEFLTLGSYKCPQLLTKFMRDHETRNYTQSRALLFWINENFQKLTAQTKTCNLYRWSTPPLVENAEFRKIIWQRWEEIISGLSKS